MNLKDKSIVERLQAFQEGLAQLIRDTDIEPIPTLHIGVSAMVSQITLIDLQNEAMLKQFGREKVKVADAPVEESGTPPPDEEEPPFNPRAN